MLSMIELQYNILFSLHIIYLNCSTKVAYSNHTYYMVTLFHFSTNKLIFYNMQILFSFLPSFHDLNKLLYNVIKGDSIFFFVCSLFSLKFANSCATDCYLKLVKCNLLPRMPIYLIKCPIILLSS